MNKVIWIAALAWLALLAGGWWYFHARHEPPAVEAPSTGAPQSPQQAAAPAAPRHPMAPPPPPPAEEPEQPGAEPPAPPPLPPLSESDGALRAELAQAGTGEVLAMLPRQGLIEKLVLGVDSLDGKPLAPRFRPLPPAPGTLQVEAIGDGEYLLSEDNARRYEPMVRALLAVDPATVASVYQRWYPRFQQAFATADPNGYFNDRLIAAIDHLLATPQVETPIRLVRPKVLYQFADPELEALSSGQKAMLRLSAAQRAAVRDWLSRLRAELIRRSSAS